MRDMINAVIDYFRGDPEKIRVTKKLLEKLDNINDWKKVDDKYVSHKTYNIRVRHDNFSEPEHMWIPVWWQRRVSTKIKKIHRRDELEKLSFIYDNLDGKYPFVINRISNEQRAWLKENATDDQYTEFGYNLYISDETLAMGYKLQWM